MDKESIRVGAAYKELEAQHFNGGCFSEKVRLGAELFGQLTDEEKRTVFADTFNATYSLAVAIKTHYRFNEETREIDLSDEGLGTFGVDLTYFSPADAELEGGSPYRGIVMKTPFFDYEEDYVFAGLDGRPIEEGQDYDINQEVLRLLDTRETLEVIRDAIGMPEMPAHSESLLATA